MTKEQIDEVVSQLCETISGKENNTMKRNSSNTTVNEICKRDRIFAFATADHSLEIKRDDDKVTDLSISENDQVTGYGHWDTGNGGVRMDVDAINGCEQWFDCELSTRLWDIFVMVRFEP